MAATAGPIATVTESNWRQHFIKVALSEAGKDGQFVEMVLRGKIGKLLQYKWVPGGGGKVNPEGKL